MTRKQLISGLAGLGLVLGTWTGCYISRGITTLDHDQDGFDEGHDCDDENAAIYPGAIEICTDHVDNDCDGKTDFLDPECESGAGGAGGSGAGGAGTGGSGTGGSGTGGVGGTGTGGSGGGGTGGSTSGGGGAGGSSSSGGGGLGGSGGSGGSGGGT